MSSISILIIFYAALAIKEGYSLQCYWCTHSSVSSDNFIAKPILKLISTISNDHCLLDNALDMHEVDLRTCPTPSPGYVYKCGKIEGTVTATFGSDLISIHMHTVERDCVEVSIDDEESADGCRSTDGQSGGAKALLDEALNKLSIGDVTFEGENCYDSIGVTVPKDALLCPVCTWSEWETDNSVIEVIRQTFSLLKNDHCLLEDPEDLENVGFRQCKPSARPGDVVKCADLKGTMYGEFAGVNWEVRSLNRKCVTVPTKESVLSVSSTSYEAYTDGCHDSQGDEEVVQEIVAETLNNEEAVENVKFNGQACYIRDYASVAEFLTSGAVNVNISSFLLVVFLVFFSLKLV